MTDEVSENELPRARVATRPGVSGVAEKRRRLYQRHLLLFVAVNGGLLAVDQLTSPGLQWAHFLSFPWLLVFLIHTLGLVSRGYGIGELVIPPRRAPLAEVYDTPLDYELVRSRQLRDGVVNAAAALPQGTSLAADEAVDAADELVGALEGLVKRTRGEDGGQAAEALVPDAREALTVLDRLHQELIRVEVLGADPDGALIEAVRGRAAALRELGG